MRSPPSSSPPRVLTPVPSAPPTARDPSRPTASAWWRAACGAAVLAVALGSPVAAGPEDRPATAVLLDAAQLDTLVAPVALYPDVVLDSLLPATTAPADVVAAAAHVAAQGGDVAAAPTDAVWDPNVVALLQFPDVLRWMAENPEWVDSVGFAVAMQQGDVLAAVQRYRTTAHAAGVLETTAYANVTVTPGPTRIIVIQPVSPDVVYVPVYDPWLLSGSYVYAPSRPFFSAWFGFTFATSGLWSRSRIYWGAGIYDYGNPWWYGSWRNEAADWGTHRPTRWHARRTADQPWTRGGFDPRAAGRVRVSSPTYGPSVAGPTVAGRAASPTRRVGVAPSAREYRRSRSGDVTAPASRASPVPAVPVVRRRVAPTAAPDATTRRPAPSTGARRAHPTPRTPTPRFAEPTPTVVPRGTARAWSTRGRGSLEGSSPRAAPVAPRRATPPPTGASPPRATPPRAAPPARRMPPVVADPQPLPDRARTRKQHDRGASSLIDPK